MNGGAPAVLAAELHYLQFNGTSDYAVADAVFGGISGDYTIAIKVAGRISAGNANATYFASGGPGVTSTSARDLVRAQSAFANTNFIGFDGNSVTKYSVTATSMPADASARVLSVARDTAALDAFARIVKASGVEFSGSDSDITGLETPDHIGVGSRIDSPTLTPTATYGNVKFIGLVLASVQIPDAELTAWLNDDTAIGNITGIDHYWVASDIDGASIPARVGTVALALTGPAVGDLVAWSP